MYEKGSDEDDSTSIAQTTCSRKVVLSNLTSLVGALSEQVTQSILTY